MNQESTRDLVIKILSTDFPLTTKQIYAKLRAEYHYNHSYQSVHKLINKLHNENILEKQEKKYLINLSWIDKTSKIIKSIEDNYFSKKDSTPIKPEGNIKTLFFKSLAEAEKFRKEMQYSYLSKQQSFPYCSQSSHLRSPVVFSEKSIRVLNAIKLTKVKCYLIVKNSTVIDNWCANYYRNMFVKIKTGVDFSDNSDIYVMDDLVMQVFFPDSLKRDIELFYSKTKNISKLNVVEFHKKFYESKNDIKVLLFKNSEIAEQLRNYILSFFEETSTVSFFDVDGTLVKGFSLSDFVKFLYDKKYTSKENYDKFMHPLSLYHSSKLSYEAMAKLILKEYGNIIKGKTVSEIKELVQLFIKSEKFELYPYSIELINKMNSLGKTIAVTGSPYHLAHGLNNLFNFNKVAGTTYELKDNVFTGKVKKDMSIAIKKKKFIKDYIKTHSFNLKKSFAFGDTEHDIPLFESVSNPIYLNPNKELKEYMSKKKIPACYNVLDYINKKIESLE